MARNYAKEYANYQGTPAQKKKRAARGRSRYALMKKGKVRLGDGVDVIHKNGNALDTSSKNLGTSSPSSNRSYPRTASARKVNPRD
jgi:hypothetical protein